MPKPKSKIKYVKIRSDFNEELIKELSKQYRFDGSPPTSIMIEIPESKIDKDGNVIDSDFAEKAAHEALNARYGKEIPSPINTPEFAKHKYFRDLPGRISSIGPENRGFTGHNILEGIKSLNPMNIIHAIRKDDWKAIAQDPNLTQEEKIAQIGMSEPIVGDVARAAIDPGGEAASLLPMMAIGAGAISPKARAVIPGAIKGMYNEGIRPTATSASAGGFLGSLIGGSVDPSMHGVLLGGRIGALAGTGLNLGRAAFRGATEAAADRPWINAMSPLETTEAPPYPRSRGRMGQPMIEPGPQRIFNMGYQQAGNTYYPPGTTPEFTQPPIQPQIEGKGTLQLQSGSAPIIPPEPRAPTQIGPHAMPSRLLQPPISRTQGAIPLPPASAYSGRTINVAPSFEAPSSEPPMMISPESTPLEKAQEIVERIRNKRAGPELPEESAAGGTTVDKRILELQQKDVLSTSESSELNKLLKDRGDLDVAAKEARDRDEPNTITSPETASGSEINHEELYKLADMLGVKATPLARALIQKGYNVAPSKFGTGQWGIERIGKKSWPEGLSEEQLTKLLDLMGKKVP